MGSLWCARHWALHFIKNRKGNPWRGGWDQIEMAHFHCKRLFWMQISIHSVFCLEEDCNVSNLRVCPSIFLSLNFTEYGSKLSVLVGLLFIHGVFGFPGALTLHCYSNCGTPLQNMLSGWRTITSHHLPILCPINNLILEQHPSTEEERNPPASPYPSENWLQFWRLVHHLWGKF